jgi:hypothetical protein
MLAFVVDTDPELDSTFVLLPGVKWEFVLIFCIWRGESTKNELVTRKPSRAKLTSNGLYLWGRDGGKRRDRLSAQRMLLFESRIPVVAARVDVRGGLGG